MKNKKFIERFRECFDWVIETDGGGCNGIISDCEICPIDCEHMEDADHLEAVKKWLEDNK